MFSKHTAQQSSPALSREGDRFRDSYRIQQSDAFEDVDALAFDRAHRIDGVIRIVSDEYGGINTSLSHYTHFNLEHCGHQIGARYALPKILSRGYYRSSDDEVPPTLSFAEVLVGVCTAVREHVPYHALHAADFRYSMKHIQNVEELQKAILARYLVSMPNLSEREILERGVAVTTLRLEGML